MTPEKNWYKYCRPHLEWFNWQDDINVDEYSKNLVERAIEFNSNTLVYPFEEGGYLLYPGKMAPMNHHLNGQDLLAALQQSAHEQGLQFVLCFLGAWSNTYMSNTHPDWVSRDREGNPAKRWDPHYNWVSLCMNSPFGDYLIDNLCEVLALYKPDGIYIEGVMAGSFVCGCTFCKAKFAALYHRDLNPASIWKDKDIQEFGLNNLTNFYRQVRKAVDTLSPETIIFGSSYYGVSDPSRIGPFVDLISNECQWGYEGYVTDFTLPEVGLIIRSMHAESQKPVIGTCWIPKHPDKNHASRSTATINANFLEILSNGGTVQVHTQTVFDVDPTKQPLLKRLYENVETLRPFLIDADILSTVGIYNSAPPLFNNNYPSDALRGFYRVLIEEHIPFDIVSPQQILSSDLDRFKAIILPDVHWLDDAIVEALKGFVHRGGSLIMTNETGLYTQDGQRLQQGRFDSLAGIIRLNSRRVITDLEYRVHSFFRVISEHPVWESFRDRLLSSDIEYEEVDYEDDVHVASILYGYDFPRMHKDHNEMSAMPGPPKWPLVLTRKVEQGKVVYISGNLDACFKRKNDVDCYDILAASVHWACENQYPLITNCPPSVEITTHIKPGCMAVILHNQTFVCQTNIGDKFEPVRRNISLYNIKLQIQNLSARISSITALGGRTLSYNQNDAYLDLSIDQLDEIEAILIQFD